MAEREGFEPPVRLPVRRISSAVRSTTLPPLRGRKGQSPVGRALCIQALAATQVRGRHCRRLQFAAELAIDRIRAAAAQGDDERQHSPHQYVLVALCAPSIWCVHQKAMDVAAGIDAAAPSIKAVSTSPISTPLSDCQSSISQ